MARARLSIICDGEKPPVVSFRNVWLEMSLYVQPFLAVRLSNSDFYPLAKHSRSCTDRKARSSALSVGVVQRSRVVIYPFLVRRLGGLATRHHSKPTRQVRSCLR